MAKLVLNDIDSLANTASAKQALNENFTDIEAAIENTLSRDGTTPNQMEADIDMNSNDLLNAGRVDAVEFYKNGVPFEQTVAYANKLYDLFSGTGAQTDFVMQTDPGSLGNLYVSVGGADLKPGIDYNYDGTTLKFVVAPAAGTNNIYVRYDRALATEDSVLRQDLFSTTAGKGSALIYDEAAFSPEQYGAIGDAVTDDTAAVIACVAAAVAAGGEIVWRNNYLTTATIPNLHTVRHKGPGTIRRSGNIFYPDPKAGQVNRLYVATTGVDTNDGLSALQPTLTINAAMNRLPNYGPFLDGDWRVILAAGTYAPCTFPARLGAGYIRLWGPSVGGHPNVPTAIIDAGGAANGFCIAASEHVRMDVRDVKLQNATGTLSIGLAATMFCDVYLNNVHTDNIYTGIQVTQNSRLRQTGGVHTPGANGQIGVAVGVTSSMSIGFQAPSGFGSGPRFTGAFSQAVKITENTTGHVDYCVIDGADIGIELTQNCRVNDVGNDIKNCTVAAVRSTQSCYANAGNVFTANATNFINDAYSSYLPTATGSQGVLRQGVVTSTITHTGTVAKTILATPFTIPAGYFTDNSKQLRVRITGKFTSAGVISVGFDLGGSVAASLASAGATANTQFEAEFNMFATAAAAQKYQERLIQGTAVVRHASSTRTINMGAAQAVQIVGTLPNAADTLVIDTVEVWMTG